MNLDASYWAGLYEDSQTGWDIGYANPQLVAYFKTIQVKDIQILIPGCGNGYEAIWLVKNGFTNVTVVDLVATPLQSIQDQTNGQIKTIKGDFFDLEGTFDLIVEQTFFCALDPSFRKKYVEKMEQLLHPDGELVGLLFSIEFERKGPPFGGLVKEYLPLFSKKLEILEMDTALLSIKPRQGTEVFFRAKKLG